MTTDKILVCITAQSNSKRLMDCGAALCKEEGGELHILHVQKGNNIFENEDTPRLLQALFEYGSQMGGMIHAYCDEDVPKSIGRFIQNEKITHIVIGEPPLKQNPALAKVGNELFRILGGLPKPVAVTVVPRESAEQVG